MKKTILFLLLITSVVSFGQRKYAADNHFKKFEYKKAIKLYEDIYKKGDKSYTVVSRLADSYYHNADFKEAEKWYNELVSSKKDTISSEHIFRYAHALKTNGKVEESDKWLLKLKDYKNNDSRALALENKKDYFVEYTNKEKVFLNVHNLSSNTEFSDFGGFIFKDKFYFASTQPDGEKPKRLYKWNNQPFINAFSAYLKETQNKENKEVLDVEKPSRVTSINTKYHESNIVITEDGNTMFFTRDNYDGRRLRSDEKEVTHLKLYSAKRIANGWGEIKELPFNSNHYSVGHPALSVDEKTLYFVSDMPGGFGATDLYKVRVYANGAFGEPENLGREINTEGREMFPFIGSDETLYFSSDGHIGLGALDIFESKKEKDNYTSPVNLGAQINSPFDDFSFCINKELTQGFFTSNKEGGKGDDDIYSFRLHKQEECIQTIAGVIKDKNSQKPLSLATVKLVDTKGKVINEVVSQYDGSYSFTNIPCNSKFTLLGSKLDYKPDTKETLTPNNSNDELAVNLNLTPLIVGDQIVINPIYFDYDKSFIREDAKKELEHVISVMRNHPTMVIKIESHTDSRGGREYNRKLSDRRAKSTRDYILSRGIEVSRIQSAIGFGEVQLLNDCNDVNSKKCSEEEHQLNRRSYFYILKK